MAFLPPSSSDSRLSRRPAVSAMRLPVAPLPVKLMTGTSGLSTRAMPAVLTRSGDQVDDARRQAGLLQQLHEEQAAQPGVSDAGLRMTVLPLMSAGIIFQHGMAIGKFQGVMSPATPMGSRMLIAHLSGSSEGTVSPNSRRPSPAIRYAMSMPSWTSPRASSRTLPISRVMWRARRSLCCAMSAPKAYRISPRLGAGVRLHASLASPAARMACATSDASDAAYVPMTRRSSAGSRDSNTIPEFAACHSPPMRLPCWIASSLIARS